MIVLEQRKLSDSRPDLGARLGDHCETGRLIVESDPGNLLERVEGRNQLIEGSDVLQFGSEPHDWQLVARNSPMRPDYKYKSGPLLSRLFLARSRATARMGIQHRVMWIGKSCSTLRVKTRFDRSI